MKSIIALIIPTILVSACFTTAQTNPPDAVRIVNDAFDYYRDKASVAVIEMTIHRPDWERTQVIKVWTVGEKDSLLTTLEPAKDKGNGTLKKDEDMWVFNPKVNRTIKIPPSMMAQSWMGSDFSNNDLAKSNNIIAYYSHKLIGTSEIDGHRVYTIESTPNEGAPVVWGKQILKIRDDCIFLEESYFDESGERVKTLSFSDIQDFGGKLYPATMRMSPTDKPEQYTIIHYRELVFLDTLPDHYFTLTALKSPPTS